MSGHPEYEIDRLFAIVCSYLYHIFNIDDTYMLKGKKGSY